LGADAYKTSVDNKLQS